MEHPGQTPAKPGRREEILATATALFGRHGVHGVTTRQIAGQVGISQPSLYAHFASIQQIQDEVSARAFALLEARLAGVAEASPQDQLRQAIAGYIDFGLRHPDAYRIAFMLEHPKAASPDGPHDMQAFAAINHPGPRVYGHLRRMVAAVRPDLAGASATGDLEPLIQSLWATLHGLVSLLIARPDFPWADRDRLITLHADQAYRMVAP